MMDTIDRFIKQIFSLDVEAKEYILTVAGWLPRSSYPGAPYTRKDYRWQLNRVDEREMLVLHDAAVDHVAILPKESINNLNRIHEQRANRFTSFFDFIKGLYVKVSDGLHTGLDISDFEQKIEGRFNVKLPERGAINISFLDDLLDELTFKSGLFDGFREAVGLLLDNSAKAKDKTEAEQLFEEVDGRGKDGRPVKCIGDYLPPGTPDAVLQTVKRYLTDHKKIGKKTVYLLAALNKNGHRVQIDNQTDFTNVLLDMGCDGTRQSLNNALKSFDIYNVPTYYRQEVDNVIDRYFT